jgi:hypothetical protein
MRRGRGGAALDAGRLRRPSSRNQASYGGRWYLASVRQNGQRQADYEQVVSRKLQLRDFFGMKPRAEEVGFCSSVLSLRDATRDRSSWERSRLRAVRR